ncbi:hypothetical protein COX95_00050 [bacterium CG_4_10_14_0_2_um_filter_33_32]|nr:MAG: hypothetical protein AUJ93_03175 [bacterium CG2_30_33_46]PIR67179.1 MAG: hypothetical protein COU50_04475 [bacterium CG10_big_fil_rev_8_21_14_0_10_33_18]PIU76571.1 MAG: hypothetical protein COS74_03395 [bacterium CG06_land_8_20_14_3_00_33_50]PIY85590.1 MAG: hypothetical protein COY76_01210 [bacterium CG_4_10_14_0_8_um_filter_33_57]PIZ86695.1 MAG: hypothetical protein COX95_00050 [bacterium CG_4_10_14_0_2_um_filter_33_32]PJA72024.1 MAG: hypothetical protein CO152_03650 [bacterium CG_4_9
MKIGVKRIDKTISLPNSAKDSIKINLISRRDVVIEPAESRLVPVNVVVDIPKNYLFLVTLSPDLAKKGLVLFGGLIVIDSADNSKEELTLPVYNFTKERSVILQGEIAAQGALVKSESIAFQEIKK